MRPAVICRNSNVKLKVSTVEKAFFEIIYNCGVSGFSVLKNRNWLFSIVVTFNVLITFEHLQT